MNLETHLAADALDLHAARVTLRVAATAGRPRGVNVAQDAAEGAAGGGGGGKRRRVGKPRSSGRT